MGQAIAIRAGDQTFEAELNDSPTAQAIAAALPIEGAGNRWGEEIYFSIPVDCALQADARDVLESGELAYWPPGKAFCIFWGPTPASQGDEIRAASEVNIVGRIRSNLSALSGIPQGVRITIAAG